MRSDRMAVIVKGSALLVILTLALVVLGMALTASPAQADGASLQTAKGELVEFGNDVVVGPGQDVPSAAAFGGDITVRGTVRQSVIAFGGNITVSGTVRESVVAFGGDVRLLPTAVVGSGMKADDPTVVSFGGKVISETGAQVTGGTKELDGSNWREAFEAIGGGDWGAWFGWSFAGWLVQTAICLVLGLVAAALMPKQLLAVQRSVAARPAASLGWGALTFFVIVPVALIVLVVTIIGILVAIPLAIVVALAYFFVTTGVAALLAQRVLGSGGRQVNLMLAVTIGVVATTLISQIPVAGTIAVLAMTVFGVGAGVLAFVEWRRDRKAAPAPAGPAGGLPGGPAGYPAPPTPGAPAAAEAGTPGLPSGATAPVYQPAPSPGQIAAADRAPAAEARTAIEAVEAAPQTIVETVPVEPQTTVETPAADPQTIAEAAPAESWTAVQAPAAEPQPPQGPTAPDATQLPQATPHVVPPAGAPGTEG